MSSPRATHFGECDKCGSDLFFNRKNEIVDIAFGFNPESPCDECMTTFTNLRDNHENDSG